MSRESPRPDEQETNSLTPEEAKTYERKAAIYAIVVFVVIVFAGAIAFDISQASWAPSPPQSIFSSPDDTPSSVRNQETYGQPKTYGDTAADTPENVTVISGVRRAYDLPVRSPVADDGLNIAQAEVKAIAPRRDQMTDGKARVNLYARTEYYLPNENMNCYFHQYMGAVATYEVGDRVLVQYDPRERDICGSSRIVQSE